MSNAETFSLEPASPQSLDGSVPQRTGSDPGPLPQTVAMPVLGMSCAACQHHVQSALSATPGVLAARVDWMRHLATVEYDPSQTAPEALVAAIRDSGYEATLPPNGTAVLSPQPTPDFAGWKAALTIAAGILVMLFSMPFGGNMTGHPETAKRGLLSVTPWLLALPHKELRWGLLLVTGVVAVWAGAPIYRSAWKALLHRETNMNTLVSLGTMVAFAYSAYGTIWTTADNSLYLDSVLLILGFLLLGKWLEARARNSALAAVNALAALLPATARVRRKEGETTISVDALQVGDCLIVLPGERIPADAQIKSGRTTVDESMLTGESLPLERGVGERILAGSLNYDGAIEAEVEFVGEGTALSQIARMVQQAQGSRAPMERLADRASAIFVPVVLALALLTFTGWLLFAHSPSQAMAATAAVLVIACPCALGLAVPAALTVAVGRGAQFGILIRGGEALERLAGIDTVAMDKTGTLTLGKPVLAGAKALAAFHESDLLRWAAAAEHLSAHPLAHAVVHAARQRGLTWPAAQNLQAIPGRGLAAQIEGRFCLLGSIDLMRERSVPLPPQPLSTPAAGVTRLWIAVDGELAGYFDARDALRPTARRAVEWLKAHRIEVEMLTGDTAGAASPIAASIGISKVSAGLLPVDKLNRIKDLQIKGKLVAMIGDGINDAAALAQADSGLVMDSGAAMAQEAGDVLLLHSDPVGICVAIGLARATVRVMRQNLIWAAGYNLLGIPLAAGLLFPVFHLMLTPWMAAAAMAFSSLSVLLNSLRLRNWKLDPLDPSILEEPRSGLFTKDVGRKNQFSRRS